MIIKIFIQGEEREIHNDGSSFTAVDPRNGRALGYFSKLGNAVNRHIKNANLIDTDTHEEVIELRSFVDRYEALIQEVQGWDLAKVSEFGELIEKEKPKKVQAEKKEVAAEPEEDDLDGL